MRFNLKFLSTILFAITFLVGGFFISTRTAFADTTIDTPAIVGISVPVTGAIPTSTIAGATEEDAQISWSGNPTVFTAGTVYTATITVVPKLGVGGVSYTLTGVPANFFTVAGATTVTNDANSGVVTAVFPATNPAVVATNATTSDFYSGDITAANVGSALANGPETINTGATQSAIVGGVITVSGAIRAKNSNVGSFTGSENGPAIAQYLVIPDGSTRVEESKTVGGVTTSLGFADLNNNSGNPDAGWFDLTKGVFRMGVYLYSGDALKTGDISLNFVFKDTNGTVLKDINYTLRFQTTAAVVTTNAITSDFYSGEINAENVGSALANGPETIDTGATQSAIVDGVITVSGAIRPKDSNVGTFEGSAAGPAIAQYILIPAGSASVEEFRIVAGVPSSLGIAALNTDPANPDRGWFDYTKGVFRMGVYLYSGEALRAGDLPLEFVFKAADGTVLKDIKYTLRYVTTATIVPVTSLSLGVAATYAVLGNTYTNTAAGTTINGDVGFTTGPAVAPLGTHPHYGSGDPYSTAGTDQGIALTTLASQACTYTFPEGEVVLSTNTTHGPIGVYTPGVYCTTTTSAASIGTGGITLSGAGTYIFRINGAFTTDASSSVTLNGASANDVFWTPTGLTTLGANSTFAGTVIDNSGITVGGTVTWTGRALAFGGTVTTGAAATITVPGVVVDTTVPVSNPTVTIWSENLNQSYLTYAPNTIFQANVNFDGGLTLSDFNGVEISLYNGTTLLATNTAKPALFSTYPNAVGATDLFGIGDTINPDDLNWNIGAYPSNLTPTSVKFILTRTDGTVYTVTGSIDTASTAVLDAAAAPVITIGDYSTAPRNTDLEVTASTNEGTLNFTSHTFTANDSFDFVATDAAGNVTTQTVTITNIDKVAPVINLVGNTTINVEYGSTYTDPGYSAYDGINGSVTVIPSGGPVNTFIIGSYVITYNATDLSGNPAISVTRTVNVVKANPTATLAVSNSPQTYSGAGQAALVGITVSSTPGAVANILTGGAATQINAGTYAVTADFVPTDTTNYNTLTGLGAGNFVITPAPAPIITSVHIASNNASPELATIGNTVTLTFTSNEAVTKLGNFKINGSNPDTFTFVGNVYTATHLVDAGDTITGVPATFQINVKNAAGIFSQTVEATNDSSSVTIVAAPAPVLDTTAPVITVTGTNPITLTVGSTYTDAGATATDNVDATVTVNSTGTVNTNTVGVYTITYSATDAAGNVATPVTRIVNVVKANNHSSSGSSATPAVPAKVKTPDGCEAGNKFSTTTGRNCNAATPAVPANGQVTGGQVLGASTQVGQVLGAEKFNFTKFLKFKAGSYKFSLQGAEVIELQKFLTTLGYDLGIADGKFGPKTEGAVIKFQIANKLKGDGVVGPLTRAVLNK